MATESGEREFVGGNVVRKERPFFASSGDGDDAGKRRREKEGKQTGYDARARVVG